MAVGGGSVGNTIAVGLAAGWKAVGVATMGRGISVAVGGGGVWVILISPQDMVSMAARRIIAKISGREVRIFDFMVHTPVWNQASHIR